MYAILDIETTGGKYNEEGITEIAIYKFDGHEVIDRFITLVNPEKEIQPFVVNLTGINNDMLKNAPKFYEVAKQIVEITENCILVAHNAQFDNRILTTEFDRLGYQYKRDTLCTVELSKKLIPNLPSYKLGNLCKSLGIPLSSRHRADGDALATVKLFKLLLNKDSSKEIIEKSVKSSIQKKLAPKFSNLIENLPNKIGVFHIQNSNGVIIYSGKSKNIKKAVNQLFLKDSKKNKKIQDKVSMVSFEETGNDLIARLKFAQEIKSSKPKFNSQPRIINTTITFNHPNFLIIDKGRHVGEKSVVVIENNELIGYAFIDLTYQITHIDILKNLISPMESSNENKFFIKNHLEKNKIEKLIRF